MQNLNLIIKKYKIKLRDILQSEWPVLFKSQGQERQRKIDNRLKKTQVAQNQTQTKNYNSVF